jgi:hypothetical protein
MMFHWYVCKAVWYVAEAILLEADNGTPEENMLCWTYCDFTGEETFLAVIQKLNNVVLNIVDYVKFVLKKPMIKDLLCIFSSYDDRYTCVSLLMSFDAFKHYVKKNKLLYQMEGADSTSNCEEMDREEAETDVIKSPEEVEALDAWKAKLYELYHEKFSKMKNSTLIMTDKYNKIVNRSIELQRLRWKGPIKGPLPSDALKYDKVYELKSNIGKWCLYRKNLMVTTYKEVFDVMLSKHASLGHARDIKKNKAKLDQEYYLIPESCVKLFLQICPDCFPARQKKQNNKVPLKMILTPRIGHRAQIDLIDMGALAISGEHCILWYVDHLSGFSYVHTLKSKAAEEVGVKLIQILSTEVVPEILQLDNGNGSLGKYIEIIKSFYSYIHIVKGRANHTQTQGKIERGHALFKEALQKWMAKHGTNWMIGAYVVNDEINQWAQWNHDNLSPYNTMYGKMGTQRNNMVFGEVAVT